MIDVRRRKFITLLGAAAGDAGGRLLNSASAATFAPFAAAFRQGLA